MLACFARCRPACRRTMRHGTDMRQQCQVLMCVCSISKIIPLHSMYMRAHHAGNFRCRCAWQLKFVQKRLASVLC